MIIGRTLTRWRCCWTSSFAESRSVLKLKTFDLRLAIPEQAIRDESNFPRRDVESEVVSPRPECLKKHGLPAFQLDIRNRREARIEHALEIEDLLEVTGFEPWRQRLFSHVERRPLRLEPFGQALRKFKAELFGFLQEIGVIEKDR